MLPFFFITNYIKGGDFSMQNKINENQYGDDIYEVLIRLSLPKRRGQEAETISSFLSDVRAIVRVTIVDQVSSKEDPFRRIMDIKVKFNVKKLPSGMTVRKYVRDLLLPEIRKLDAKPTVRFVSTPRDHMAEKKVLDK